MKIEVMLSPPFEGGLPAEASAQAGWNDKWTIKKAEIKFPAFLK